MKSVSDTALLHRADRCREQVLNGRPLNEVLIDAYALVRETARRACGMAHHPEQLFGGLVLFHGAVAEMQTGEGKTLTVLLPVFLHALTGRGCHVVTANEYLAERDADFARTVLERLGVTVGCVLHRMKPELRRTAYSQDVTYSTAKEIGFDFLRDRLKRAAVSTHRTLPDRRGPEATADRDPVQRPFAFAVIDEADSVLIDDARTPFLIATATDVEEESLALFRWSARAVAGLERGADFHWDTSRRSATLTTQGTHRVLQQPQPSALASLDVRRIYRQIESALTARHGFQRDRDYVVTNGEVVIVDESTGRVLDGRKWQDGLHQAIEAQESIEITAGTHSAAQITAQSLFPLYEQLSGLTGTAREARDEFRTTYGLSMVRIPTHRPSLRKRLRPRIFVTQEAKITAIIEEIQAIQRAGRAVLVGTPSVEASEDLSAFLERCGLEHRILNCRNHSEEAQIVAEAGQEGRVTIATNMAGRGTDIRVHPDVLRCGGLHIIATEMHSSPRIDRQLIGRTARQGEPGSFRFYLSLDDELLAMIPAPRRDTWKRTARPNARGELSRRWLGRFRTAQQTLERRHRKQRRELRRREEEHAALCTRTGFDPYIDAGNGS